MSRNSLARYALNNQRLGEQRVPDMRAVRIKLSHPNWVPRVSALYGPVHKAVRARGANRSLDPIH